MKALAIALQIALAAFCIFAAVFSLYAASRIVHNPGWQVVQFACYFMAAGYGFAGLFIVYDLIRKA